MNNRDEEIINALVKIAKICGIFPSEKPSRWFYCYQITMFIFNILCSISCIYRNATLFYASGRSIDIFIDILTSCFAIMQGLSFQFSCLFFAEKWRTFYEDIKFNYNKTMEHGKTNVLVEIVVLHLIFFIRLIFSFWAWYPLIGLEATINNFFRYLNDYYCMISVVLLVHINIIIKRKYSLINKFLRSSNCLQHVENIYRKTSLLIDDFNYTFGYQILFIMGNAIASILECLNNVLKVNHWDTEQITLLLWNLFYSFMLTVSKTKLL